MWHICEMRVSFMKNISVQKKEFLDRNYAVWVSGKSQQIYLPWNICLQHASVLCPLQETATTCRERCGGQGYLSCNRFGQILGFAHAGMTAEGDNRVLMMKVAKEYMATTHLPATRARLQAGTRTGPVTGELFGVEGLGLRGFV